MSRHLISRRSFLRGTGVAVALPLLETHRPQTALAAAEDGSPTRMVCICTNMGMMPKFFWPNSAARDYKPSEYLSLIDQFREHYTVFSGVSHPDVDGGHHAEISYLTAAPHPAAGGFKNSISLDQYAAERIGVRTRFPFITLNVGAENATLSWTASGVRIPAERKPSEVFKRLFVQGSPAEVEAQVEKLREGRSVLDTVAGRAKRLEHKLGNYDREKVQQYFQSVRELEQRLVKAEDWEKRPKPAVDVEPPIDVDDPTELIVRHGLDDADDSLGTRNRFDAHRCFSHRPELKPKGQLAGRYSGSSQFDPPRQSRRLGDAAEDDRDGPNESVRAIAG